ncbi:extracellular solute-binding protein, partial [Escherichia coli]
AGVTIPEKPTWDQIAEAAKKMTDKSTETYGICLRGKAGWGENMALLTATANSFGARWFDEKWHPQFDQPEWKHALKFYVDLMK